MRQMSGRTCLFRRTYRRVEQFCESGGNEFQAVLDAPGSFVQIRMRITSRSTRNGLGFRIVATVRRSRQGARSEVLRVGKSLYGGSLEPVQQRGSRSVALTTTSSRPSAMLCSALSIGEGCEMGLWRWDGCSELATVDILNGRRPSPVENG